MSAKLKIQDTILKEDYNSQKELEKLSNDIIVAYIKKYATIYLSGRKPMMTLFKPFKNINRSSYQALQKFLIDFNMTFIFDEELPTNGQFYGNTPTTGVLTIRYNDDLFGESLQNFMTSEEDLDELVRDVYFDTFDKGIRSVIMHELQHAYDYFRSGGKYTSDKKSKKYYDELTADNNTKTASSPEKLEANRNTYSRLKHEVEARFAQAMDEVNVYRIDRHGETVIRDIKDFIDEVSNNFKWMDRMTPKIKKYLYRKASSYYHQKAEDFKKSRK